jgi:hypothetical protein
VQKNLGNSEICCKWGAELELGRDSGRGKVMSTLVKYWQRILHMDKDELVRVCYDWQINNVQYDSWAKKNGGTK